MNGGFRTRRSPSDGSSRSAASPELTVAPVGRTTATGPARVLPGESASRHSLYGDGPGEGRPRADLLETRSQPRAVVGELQLASISAGYPPRLGSLACMPSAARPFGRRTAPRFTTSRISRMQPALYHRVQKHAARIDGDDVETSGRAFSAKVDKYSAVAPGM